MAVTPPHSCPPTRAMERRVPNACDSSEVSHEASPRHCGTTVTTVTVVTVTLPLYSAAARRCGTCHAPYQRHPGTPPAHPVHAVRTPPSPSPRQDRRTPPAIACWPPALPPGGRGGTLGRPARPGGLLLRAARGGYRDCGPSASPTLPALAAPSFISLNADARPLSMDCCTLA